MRYLVVCGSHSVQRSGGVQNQKMSLCSVITCKYCLEDHNGEAEGIAFHPFPKDKEVRAKWVDMTGRDFEPSKTDYICSRHFRESDYTVKRSGKKYLKTSAIPCEYVVYPTSFFHDSESSEESNEAVAVKEEPLEPLEEEGAQRAQAFFFDEPTTSRSRSRDEPDSTYSEPWEHFLPGHHFSLLPPYLLSREAEVGSTDEQDVGSAINPYPSIDLGPHLQHLPLPRSPKPPITYDEDTQESVTGLAPRAKLLTIKKIVSKRKSSKKLIAAALDVVEEAKRLKLKLQTGTMNNHDKATAVIALQIKQIAKLTILYKRQRKKLKKISAVLRDK